MPRNQANPSSLQRTKTPSPKKLRKCVEGHSRPRALCQGCHPLEEWQGRGRGDDLRIPLRWFLKAGSPEALWFRLPSPFIRDPHCLCPLFSGGQEEKGSRRTGEGESVLSNKRRAVPGGCSRPRPGGGRGLAWPALPVMSPCHVSMAS